jgi:hypothetical protein
MTGRAARSVAAHVGKARGVEEFEVDLSSQRARASRRAVDLLNTVIMRSPIQRPAETWLGLRQLFRHVHHQHTLPLLSVPQPEGPRRSTSRDR